METWQLEAVVSMGALALALIAPVLVPIVVALLGERKMPRRLLFVAVVFSLNYGVLFWLNLLAGPLKVLLYFVVPTLQARGELTDAQMHLVSALHWYVDAQVLVLGALHLAIGVLLSFYLRKRWPAITSALAQQPQSE